MPVNTTDDARKQLIDSLNAIITAGEAKSTSLRAQRDALLKQLADLRTQIAAAEGSEAQKAREDLQQLERFVNRQRRGAQ